MLHGRGGETALLKRVLASARDGRSAALVLRGEAGIGKSALLDHAASRAQDMRVLRASGIEGESELPYAGLHLLLGRERGRIAALPDRQSSALATALGLADGPAPDRFLVGLAVLTLLGDLAEQGPVLCLVDDAHWLDRASAEALLFAARRLDAEGVILLLAVRDAYAPALETSGIAELPLEALDEEAAEAVLREHGPDLPGAERREVLIRAEGNPLALKELAAVRREGREGGWCAGAPPGRVQAAFGERIAALPQATKTLLLLAAAEDCGNLAVVLQAARGLGAHVADLHPAEDQGLVRIAGDVIAFGHPLIRSAAYQAAPLSHRIAAHRALAGALAEDQGDRRAWHRAAAATGPEEEVAVLLERTAEHARARGGLPAVSAAYVRAAELSVDAEARIRRWVAAARAEADIGRFDVAETLLERSGALADPSRRGDVALVLGIMHDAMGESEEAAKLLEDAAQRVPDEEAVRLLESAVRMAWTANDFAAVRKLGEQAARLPGGEAASALARAADGLNRYGPDAAAAQGVMAGEVLAHADPRGGAPLRDRVGFVGSYLAAGDVANAERMAFALDRECRREGALALLPTLQVVLARCRLFRGLHREARAAAEEGRRLAADTCQWQAELGLCAVLAELAAIRGDEEDCVALAAAPLERGVIPSAAQAASALSLLDLGLGRFEAALERLERTVAGAAPTGVFGALPDLVEAAVRVGRPDRAEEPAAVFTAVAAHSGQAWMRALALRCRALLTGDEKSFREALEVESAPLDRARTALVFGERLRRERRTGEARTRLRDALEGFERLGARPWAERARAELRAAGETPRRAARSEGLIERLTPQELQVVRLAAQGLSNREIGAHLFLSPRTVGYHLYKSYPKLGVASRAQLAAALAGAQGG